MEAVILIFRFETPQAIACSALMHVGILGAFFVAMKEQNQLIVGADIMSVEIIMESPNPGGGDGVQQQLIKQQQAARPTEQTEEIEFEEEIETEQKIEPDEVNEELNELAEIVQKAPVSRLTDIVLRQKPKPPARQQKANQTEKSNQETPVMDMLETQAAPEDLSGFENGQTINGTQVEAGIQKPGLAGEIQSARYVMGSASNPKPEYPRIARKRGWEGRVIVHVQIDENGYPIEVQVDQSSGHKSLDRAAVKALQKWKFKPAQRGGINIASQINIPIRFNLEDS